MTSNLPRYRRTRTEGGIHPLVKAGIFVLLPLLVVGGLVLAITDGAPTLTARAEGGSRLPEFETPGTSSTSDPGGAPTGTPTEPAETPSATDSATPSPEESGDQDSSGEGGSGDGSDESTEGDDLVATTPPREPDERPTTPPDEPTDETSSEPSEEPDPSPEPSEPPDPEPTTEPTTEPSEEPDPELPELPFIELSKAESQMLSSVDDARAEAGCAALRVDPRLTLASREHSEDMRDRSYYSHVNPDGEGPDERAADQGYTARVAENLSQGQLQSAEQVVRSWEDEGEERDRLLDCSFTSVGLGTERGGLLGISSWWTLMLGTD